MASLQLAPSAPGLLSLLRGGLAFCCGAHRPEGSRQANSELFLCRTREDTLQRAQEIFGADNQDLFVAFKARAQRKSTRRCEPHKGTDHRLGFAPQNLLTKHGLT